MGDFVFLSGAHFGISGICFVVSPGVLDTGGLADTRRAAGLTSSLRIRISDPSLKVVSPRCNA
jgi:hypothetical protein